MRILIAEDEKDLSDGLVAILCKNHYSVDAVYNGRDAIDYLRAGNYDAALLDIMMPLVDGIEVLKTIRKEGNGIPVLMLTAKTETDDKVLGLDCGADDYLAKPFSTKELLARLRALTRRNGGGKPDNTLQVGNVFLDKVNFEMFTEVKSDILGHKEFQMMEFLMANPGQFISTERFFDKIWGYDSDADLSRCMG